MAKEQTPETLDNFQFDDGDSVFSNFTGDVQTPAIAVPQQKANKANPLPEFIEDDEGPVNIDKVKTDVKPPPITAPKAQDTPKPKTARPSKPKEEGEEEDEEVPDSYFSFGDESKEPPKPKAAPKPKEQPKKEEEDEDPEDPDEEDTENNDEDSTVDSDEMYFTKMALDLKDRGTFRELQIDESKPLSEDEFFDLQEKEFEVRMEEAFEQFAEDMDADGKDFIRAKKKGMSTRDFLTKYLAPTFDLVDFDPSNKSHISKTIDHYLRNVEGLEGEEFEDRKEWLKNSGKEAIHAEKFFNKIQKSDTARKQNIMAALEQRNKEQEESVEEFKAALAEVINKTETVGVFSIDKSARKEIYEAITKPTVKAKKGTYIPKLVARVSKILSGATEKDLKDLIALTMILESDFKLPNLKQEVETQVTREAKARIGKKQPKATTSGRAKRELADFF